MPNIDYLLGGYDIYFGNPARTGVSGTTPDPGFKHQPIFAPSYNKKQVTLDGRFLIPDGMNVISCEGDCAMQMTSKSMSGMRSYTDSLDVKASVEGSGWGGRFSASVDYKNVDSSTKNSKSLFTQTEISCCVYTATLLDYDPPAFSQNFLNAAKTLSTKYSKTAYRRFIDSFGTHYVRLANMGATYGQQSEISSSSWKQMQEMNINIKASAGYSGTTSTFSCL